MRMFRVVIGGNEYEVGIEEITEKATAGTTTQTPGPTPQPAVAPQPAAREVASAPSAKTAPPPQEAASEGTITAAMPGTITDVKVSQGDKVKRGDTLMILEAMKMENEIKAPFDGIVSAVHVEKGAAVNAGIVLMVIIP